MTRESVPGPVPAPTQPRFARLGLSGKLLALGGAVGVIAAFLPLVSVSVQLMGLMSANKTAMVVGDWRGMVGLVGYLAALILAFVLYPPNGLTQKALAWAGVGAGLLVAVLAIWLLVLATDTGGADMMGMGSVKASPGFGAFINVLAGAAVLVGGLLKAREEKLI